MRCHHFFTSVFTPALLALFAFLTACGGGGGGGGGGTGPVAVGAGAFVEEYAPGAFSGSDTSFINVGNFDIVHIGTMLYKKEYISGSAGKITSLSFRYNRDVASDVLCQQVYVWLGHTDKTVLGTDRNANLTTVKGTTVNVYGGDFTVPAGLAGDTFTLTLTTPFEYNGVDNLIMHHDGGGCAGTVYLDQEQSSGYGSKWTRAIGSATGVVVNALRHVRFNFEGGDNAEVYGGTTGTSHPFSKLETPKIQYLYKAADLSGSGPVTAVGFQAFSLTAATDINYSVRLAHTSVSSLTTGGTWDDNITGSSVVAANNASLTIPAGIPAGEWFWLPLPDNQFTYNGTDNLLVEIDVVTASNTINVINNTVTGGNAYVTNNSLTGPTLTTDSVPNMKFRFNGGPVHIMPVMATDSSLAIISDALRWISNTTVQRHEIGGKGRITKIACRMDNTGGTTLGTYGMTVQMREGAVEQYTTVHDGSVTLSKDVKAGDWFEIPLSTAFDYSGTDSLQISLSAFASRNVLCDAGQDATLYTNRSYNGEYLGIATQYDVLPTLKLTMQR